MDPQKGVCVIDVGATDDEADDAAWYVDPPPPHPALSPYLEIPQAPGTEFLQPGSEDVSFMRRSGQFAQGGQVGVGSLGPYMDFYRFK